MPEQNNIFLKLKGWKYEPNMTYFQVNKLQTIKTKEYCS